MGRIERAVMQSLRTLVRPSATRVAAAAYAVTENELSRYRRGAIRRVLRDLAKRGIAAAEESSTGIVWKLIGRHALTVTLPTASVSLGDAAMPVRFSGSTRTLELRRVPVARRRRLSR